MMSLSPSKIAASLKQEVTIILLVITVLFVMPFIAVLLASQSGVLAVSAALAALNPITHLIEVRDPNGNVLEQLQASTVWPVWGNVTLEFGADDLPFQKHHTGIDIANPQRHIGDPITPFMAGKVITVEIDPDNKRGYGQYVVIDHGYNVTSLYGHMSQTVAEVGQEVKPGDLLGYEGSTGHSTGPHVHFEIRVYDIPVNPRIFMVGDPLPLGR